jgi:PPOX class probable F420-dependent enzyme
MASVLNDAAREALSSNHLAHLVTLNRDGSPQVTIVWAGLDGDEIVCAHLGAFQKVANIERDDRVALSMETSGATESGLANYLVVYGRAYVTEGGAPQVLQELAYRYIGPRVHFPPMDDPPPGYITHIVPERVAGTGPWRDAPR